MNRCSKSAMELQLQAELHLLPVAMCFAEQSSLAVGLGQEDADKLKLAAEEIFTYLAVRAAPGREIKISFKGGGYYGDLIFSFESEGFDMRAFNMTCRLSANEDEIPEETGLLIASRVVDRVRFSRTGRRLLLSVRKEKTYPPSMVAPCEVVKPLEDFNVRRADSGEIKHLVNLARSSYPLEMLPPFFAYPGKVVDMVNSGDYDAVVACDRSGHMGGGFLWVLDGGKLAECYGPYIINQEKRGEMAVKLVESCLEAIARTHITGLMSSLYTADLPVGYFERLGTVTMRMKGKGHVHAIHYRQMVEDPGLTVWSHPALEPYLKAEYERLDFAREIRHYREEGENPFPSTVLWAQFHKEQHYVSLHPVWWGKDATDTVKSYLEMMKNEQQPNIFFPIDLGSPWQCHFTPVLMEQGFEPRVLVPYGGRGDVVLFQHREAT